ncbi:MAG: hypothetical protein MJZ29_12360 [Bacteroidaceae bacterium]|nr:hypothetical protein [Bacteroidaceae bacterium]
MQNYNIRFGTNINHQYNYEQAKRLLITFFGAVEFTQAIYSRDYTAAPDDTSASTYLNFYARISSALPYSRVKSMLKEAELMMGRTPERKAQGIIDADFDFV